jgi:cob(I)alamin adenosyltransferase
MAIYTRTGDQGETSLASGQRVSKSDLRIEVCGTIDELNSVIGVSNSKLKTQNSKLWEELVEIQNDLLSIGSNLASQVFDPEAQTRRGEALQDLDNRIKRFEDFIDEMTKKMPVLQNFILPGGGKTGALLHLSRAVCRRLERKIVELNGDPSTDSGHGKIDNNILAYINRLSDLLFTMARFVNFKEKKKEVIWRKHA